MFNPMVGQYVSTAGVTTFQTAVATDAITGKILTGPCGSLYLSKSGDRAVFDLYGGLDLVPTTQWDIFVADQSTITQITNDKYEDYYPQLSPDGSRVAFVSYRPSDAGFSNVIVIRNVPHPLIEHVLPLPLGATDVWSPTFSPDGAKIAFNTRGYDNVNGSYDGLAVMNTDGSNLQLLTNPYATCDCWVTIRSSHLTALRLSTGAARGREQKKLSTFTSSMRMEQVRRLCLPTALATTLILS